MRKYRYLTFADRKQIFAWYQSNDRAADIAERLGMSVKMIYLFGQKRKPVGGYSPAGFFTKLSNEQCY